MESQMPELKTVEQMEEKVELPNQCLGVGLSDKRCAKMLPKGRHVCDHCQNRIDSASKLAAEIPFDNGHRLIRKQAMMPYDSI